MKLCNDEVYDKYEFLNPFHGVKEFNIINKLKVYYSTQYGISGRSYYIPGNYDVAPSEMPMVLVTQGFTKIKVLSIVVSNEKGTLEQLMGVLLHELRHILFAIKQSYKINSIDKDNVIYDTLYDYNIPINLRGYRCPFGSSFKVLFQNLAQISYITQPTEMDAHLETIANDFKIQYSNELIKDIKRILSMPSLYELSKFNYSVISETFNTYITFYTIIIPAWKNQMAHERFKNWYSHIYNDIEDILKQGSHPNFSFYDHILWWEKQIQIVFKKLGDIIANM